MQGSKLETAKKAAIAILGTLEERDTASITVFDTEIDLLLGNAAVTAGHKERARSLLSEVEARSSTALHEGWLTGCKSVASDTPESCNGRLSRCFFLTDGMANQGETDQEQIAAEAADIRSKAGIGTSTFGIGADYNEGLLGPMAVAGGGQFHHLRHEEVIVNTFSGELGEMLKAAVREVKLEIEPAEGMDADLISE